MEGVQVQVQVCPGPTQGVAIGTDSILAASIPSPRGSHVGTASSTDTSGELPVWDAPREGRPQGSPGNATPNWGCSPSVLVALGLSLVLVLATIIPFCIIAGNKATPSVEFIHGPTYVADWSKVFSNPFNPTLDGRVELGLKVFNPTYYGFVINSIKADVRWGDDEGSTEALDTYTIDGPVPVDYESYSEVFWERLGITQTASQLLPHLLAMKLKFRVEVVARVTVDVYFRKLDLTVTEVCDDTVTLSSGMSMALSGDASALQESCTGTVQFDDPW